MKCNSMNEKKSIRHELKGYGMIVLSLVMTIASFHCFISLGYTKYHSYAWIVLFVTIFSFYCFYIGYKAVYGNLIIIIICTVIVALYFHIAIPSIYADAVMPIRLKSQNNINQIGNAISLYHEDYGMYPDTLSRLVAVKYISAQIFVHPMKEFVSSKIFEDGYIYTFPTNNTPANNIMVYENPNYRSFGVVYVLKCNGSSEPLAPDMLEARLAQEKQLPQGSKRIVHE